MSIAYNNISRYREALTCVNRAVEVDRQAYLAPHPGLAKALYMRAMVYNNIGEPDLAIDTLPLLLPLSYGDGRTVGRFRFTAGKKDERILAVTLTNKGSASGEDLRNIRFVDSRLRPLSLSANAMSLRTVRLVIPSPWIIPRGQSVLVNVLADIRASRRHTVLLSIDSPSDVETTSAY
jgi:tetratricopeptide (TPR) repeat protein